MPVISALVASALGLALAAPTTEAAPCKVIVLNLQGKGLPASEREIPPLLTETLAGELARVSGCSIVSQNDVAQMLDVEAAKAECGDGTDSCLSEIGTALGAERVVGGSVGKIGSEFVISARLINVGGGTVDARAEQAVSGDPAKLRLAAKNVGRRLFGQPDLTSADPSDAAPLVTAPQEESGISPLVIAGAAVGVGGVIVAAAGTGLAVLANARLNDPSVARKDAIRTQGLVGVGVAAVGVVVALAGGAMVATGFLVE